MNYVNDNTLPRTKNYNCINQNCSTHINPEIKMAVFYRHKGSYNIRYICKICDKYWNIYNDTNN
jgi:aspartate carbamoyltransferase regulatory subunit